MEFKINRGFMAYQFGEKPTYCIGVSVDALQKAGTYECIVGKEEKRFTLTFQKALELVGKYGQDKVIRIKNWGKFFVLPVKDLEDDN